jgi:hypothetical protein
MISAGFLSPGSPLAPAGPFSKLLSIDTVMERDIEMAEKPELSKAERFRMTAKK